LRRLVVLAKQTLLEVRHYIFDLKPLLEGEAGVTAAMRNQVREFTTVSGLPVALRVTGEEGTLPVALGTALYRIVQEAMANVYRHAGASEVRLSIAFEPETVTIEVRDDGTGIAPGRDPGRGLTQMRQRVEDLRGTVSIESEPGRGTVLRATLPRENRG
ncbi:MAG: ATP-binding protein, partial [Chloroflexi bacterium]|nr:ATP-binding protein [Chloroflexota bacterium]